MPILVADKENKIIAAIHSGWKGANSGIIENLIKNLKKRNQKFQILSLRLDLVLQKKIMKYKKILLIKLN